MKFPDKLQVMIQVDSLYNNHSPTAFSIVLFKINSFFQLKLWGWGRPIYPNFSLFFPLSFYMSHSFINSTNMWWARTMCQVSASMSCVLGGEYRGDKAEFLPHWKQNVQWTLWTSWGFPEGFLLSFLPSFSLSFLRWQGQSSEKWEMAIILPCPCLYSFQPKMKESGSLVLILSSSETQSHFFQVT